MKKILLVSFLGIFLITGCASGSTYSQDTDGLPTAKTSEVVELKDGDHYDLTAQMVVKDIKGEQVKMLAYNGMIPGPFLKVKRGSTITINFKNQTDEETTLHSHGVRLDNAFDGTHLTQQHIPVGGTFTYEITFPDTGIYWYHPHVREDYAQEMGLYGNYLVQSENPDYWSPVNQEIPLVIDDLDLEEGKIEPFDRKYADHVLMGRYGNTPFVNGDTDYQVKLTAGEVVRFYVTNVSNARPYQLTIPKVQLKLVGGDASKIEREEFVESVVLSPSERAVIEAFFPSSGEFEIVNKNSESSTTLGKIIVRDGQLASSYADQFQKPRVNADVIADIDAFRAYFDKPVDKSLRLTVQTTAMGDMMMHGDHMMMDGMMMGEAKKIEWEDTMGDTNTDATSKNTTWKLIDEATGKENMDIDWKFKQGDVVKVRIFNDQSSMHPMQHPIHLHGQRFLILSTNGVQSSNLVWKDTTLVQTGDTMEILVEMSNPGKWMLHCHIAEHLEGGMMLGFEVLP